MLKWLNEERSILLGNMKRLLIIITLLSLALTSCSLFRTDFNDCTVTTEAEKTLKLPDTTMPDETEAETTVKEEIQLPCLIGFYDDLQNNGNYTRLEEWNAPWIAGKDIAVFDIIPSNEETLYSASYKRLWNEEAERNFPSQTVKPNFLLRYTLADGTVREISIKNYADAQKVTDEGYLEVYLYDDIHQDNGAWYYHLTADTTNENTVISSFKLTAGTDISCVSSVTLTVFAENSSSATINVICKN